MYKNHQVTQLSGNIFKVERYLGRKEEWNSLIVLKNTNLSGTDAGYSFREDHGILEFLKNGKRVIREMETPFTVSFEIGPKDGIYGLGMHQDRRFNYRNTVIPMIQSNGERTSVPFFTSTGGYAVLIDNYSEMKIGIDRSPRMDANIPADIGKFENAIHIDCQDDACLVYYLILAETIDGQIAEYRKLTGKAPLFPKWAYGFFQSREHYKTQRQLLDVAREFRKRKIPLDCIVQDWNYWGDLGWNALLWSKDKFPDPKKMLDTLHNELHLKMMLSVWPSFGPDTAVAGELEAIGAVLSKADPSKESWGKVHDPYNKEAADLIWVKMKKEFFDIGVDAWWLDSTEPGYDDANSLALLDCKDCCLGPNRRYLNTYALQTSQNVYERQRAAANHKRVFILTRSGFAGQQRNATLTWTGDITASWDVFRAQVSSLLNFSASGIPYSTTDIGAFYVNYDGGNENPEYRELYTRWFWFGAFSPIFRSHGTSTPREIWYFGPEGSEYFDAQMAALRLRYRLLPYIYSTAFRVYSEDYTLMRPLVMDFPNDRRVRDIGDSYMFGESLLVSIVTKYQARQQEVYLPQGEAWFDFYTEEKCDGGNIKTDAPLNRTPLFVKGGSILLTGKDKEFVDQMQNETVTATIYPGKNAHAFLYEDEGDGYGYEKEAFSMIDFDWDEPAGTLKIGERKGKFQGMFHERDFNIRLAGGATVPIHYDGKEQTVRVRPV